MIENEFGEVSVDDQLIGDRATQIKTLTNGCICCTRSNELEDALLDLSTVAIAAKSSLTGW